jgi:hypothetical protein
MDQAEKSVLLKIFESLTVSEKKEQGKSEETAFYLKEPKEYLNRLQKRMEAFNKSESFSIGDLVIWKDGLKNKRLPLFGQPSIIIKVFDPPLEDKEPSVNERLDIQIGFITDDDEFLTFNYDSHRFQLCEPLVGK